MARVGLAGLTERFEGEARKGHSMIAVGRQHSTPIEAYGEDCGRGPAVVPLSAWLLVGHSLEPQMHKLRDRGTLRPRSWPALRVHADPRTVVFTRDTTRGGSDVGY